MNLKEINYPKDLTTLGIPNVSIVSPQYGYSGTFTPEYVFPHHTASHRNSGDNWWVLSERHYQFLVGRSATVGLGGYQVRQGHAGNGNTAKSNSARNGQITSSNWAKPGGPDDSGSAGNQYGMGVCLDIDGIGEVASDAQWNSFVTLIALMLVRSGKTQGHVLQHQGYTSRKIDVKDGRRSSDQFWNDIGTTMTKVRSKLEGGKVAVVETMFAHPKSQGYWMVDATGRVKEFGVKHYGDLHTAGVSPTYPITNGSPTPSGSGYWLLGSDGGVFAFGDAGYFGNVYEALKGKPAASPCREICGTPDGRGYWIQGDDGGIFSFGNAAYKGNWFD